MRWLQSLARRRGRKKRSRQHVGGPSAWARPGDRAPFASAVHVRSLRSSHTRALYAPGLRTCNFATESGAARLPGCGIGPRRLVCGSAHNATKRFLMSSRNANGIRRPNSSSAMHKKVSPSSTRMWKICLRISFGLWCHRKTSAADESRLFDDAVQRFACSTQCSAQSSGLLGTCEIITQGRWRSSGEPVVDVRHFALFLRYPLENAACHGRKVAGGRRKLS